MGCRQDTLNISYNAYIKPTIMKYGSEVMITANNTQLDLLERTQFNALRLICRVQGSKDNTSQPFIHAPKNLPIRHEIQKQVARSLVTVSYTHLHPFI